jgi:hypothetical protein
MNAQAETAALALTTGLSNVESNLTTAVNAQAETTALALTTGLSNVETNLTSAMGTQTAAPSLTDIEGAINAALDERVGSEEHPDETNPDTIVPATGLYALMKGAQGDSDVQQSPWIEPAITNYVVPRVMETLLDNIELPAEWRDVIRQVTYKSHLEHWQQYSPEQIQGRWARYAPTYIYDIVGHATLIRGLADNGSPFVVAVRADGFPPYHIEVWCTLMNDTNPEKAYDVSAYQDQSIVKKANDLITQAVATASRIDELVMLARWTAGEHMQQSSHPTELEMPNPFEGGNHDAYEEARQQASETICLLQEAANAPHGYGPKFLQYHDPRATDPWIIIPKE